MKDGLSQQDRYDRFCNAKPFAVVSDRISSLLRQAEIIAGCIRYYNLSGKKEGDFGPFFQLSDKDRDQYGNLMHTGEMEPALALFHTFIHQLHRLTTRFNKRWEDYISWYMDDCLQLSSQTPVPDATWLTFTKNISKHVLIRKNTRFTFSGAESADRILFRTTEPIQITNAAIAAAHVIRFDRSDTIFPACQFNIPTTLKIKSIINDTHCECTTAIGLSISSPVLLLREGKRFLSITFETERGAVRNRQHLRNLVQLLRDIQKETAPISRQNAKEVLLIRLFSDLFYLEISTSGGWQPIGKYVMRGLTLSLELQDDFPSTSPCSYESHQYESEYPTLRILLNRNAWLYPYSWLKEFMIASITLQVEAQGIHNVLFYNELGKVDNSVPFAPFGNNTEQGAWFAVGNYEMSVKNVQSAQMNISWQQLPSDEGGLWSHYQGYGEQIDNRSFKIKTRYLSDYKWKETPSNETLYLFSTLYKNKDGTPAAQQKLSDETQLRDIRLYEMKPVYMDEEEYDYSIHSKSGFFSCMLEEPEMGFGEKAYRHKFSEQLIRRTLQKKKANLLNPPITPLIERITLSYKATEKIDFRRITWDTKTIVSHIYPLGVKQIYPSTENSPKPAVFSLDTDVSICIGLANMKGDEALHLFFEFYPRDKEIQAWQLPRVRWYWGNGYDWAVLPDDAITVNTTKNLLVSGKIKISLPEIPSGSQFYDKNGILWLRAGITHNEESISKIKNIYTHAIKVCREHECMGKELPDGFRLDAPELSLPGLETVFQITPFETGIPAESQISKQVRISEYITHRDRAVTARDYERMTLQAFPRVGKVKCLCRNGVVTLVIIPCENNKGIHYRPYATAELLLDIEEYFSTKSSSFVKVIDAVNPVYEEVLFRCSVDFIPEEHSKAYLRAVVKKVINQMIAPWQQEGKLPVLGYSFTIQEVYDRISKLNFVRSIDHLSVVQLQQVDNKYSFREYNHLEDMISPSSPDAILVPFRQHEISRRVNEEFGIEEMGVNEHFVIWRNETERH